jgi:hypothetical protein
MPAEAAKQELLRHRDTQFDATVIDGLLDGLNLADKLSMELTH